MDGDARSCLSEGLATGDGFVIGRFPAGVLRMFTILGAAGPWQPLKWPLSGPPIAPGFARNDLAEVPPGTNQPFASQGE